MTWCPLPPPLCTQLPQRSLPVRTPSRLARRVQAEDRVGRPRGPPQGHGWSLCERGPAPPSLPSPGRFRHETAQLSWCTVGAQTACSSPLGFTCPRLCSPPLPHLRGPSPRFLVVLMTGGGGPYRGPSAPTPCQERSLPAAPAASPSLALFLLHCTRLLPELGPIPWPLHVLASRLACSLPRPTSPGPAEPA